MCKSSPCNNPEFLQFLSFLSPQVNAETPVSEWDGKWLQSFNLFLGDHYHYLQSLLCIIRGFIFFALQKLSLITSYLQIAADSQSSLWRNEDRASYCITMILTLFLPFSKYPHSAMDQVQAQFRSIYLCFQPPLSFFCQVTRALLSSPLAKKTRDKSRWGNNCLKYFFAVLFKNVQIKAVFSGGYPSRQPNSFTGSKIAKLFCGRFRAMSWKRSCINKPLAHSFSQVKEKFCAFAHL